MITVQRTDYKERTITNRRTGKVIKTIPAHYECRYLCDGKEIAWYDSKDNVVYLRTDYLAKPFSAPYEERMKNSKYVAMWNELIEFLNINKDTRLSEYTNL